MQSLRCFVRKGREREKAFPQFIEYLVEFWHGYTQLAGQAKDFWASQDSGKQATA